MTKINWKKPLKRVRKVGGDHGDKVQHTGTTYTAGVQSNVNVKDPSTNQKHPTQTPTVAKPENQQIQPADPENKIPKDTWYRKELTPDRYERYMKEPNTRTREGRDEKPGGEGLGDKVEHQKEREEGTRADGQSSHGPIPMGTSATDTSSVGSFSPLGASTRQGKDQWWTTEAARRAGKSPTNKALLKLVKFRIGRKKKPSSWKDTGSKPEGIPDSKGNDKRDVPKQTDQPDQDIFQTPFKSTIPRSREVPKPHGGEDTSAQDYVPPEYTEEKVGARPHTKITVGPKQEREGSTNPAMGSLEKPRKSRSAIENIDRAMLKLKRSLDASGTTGDDSSDDDSKGVPVKKLKPLGRRRWYVGEGNQKEIRVDFSSEGKIELPEEKKPREVDEKSPAPSGKKPYTKIPAGGFVHEGKEPTKVTITPDKKENLKVKPSNTSAVDSPKEADPPRLRATPKADYFIEEIRSNVIYHNKVLPLLGMVAGQVSRGAAAAGKKMIQAVPKIIGPSIGSEPDEENDEI